MKIAITAKPYSVERNPRSMFSRPRLGPIVRSSMISIGAASEPERISSARSVVSWTVKLPVIWNWLPNSPWMRRDRDRFALAFLVQDDRHQLADVVARDRAHRAAAGLVEPH